MEKMTITEALSEIKLITSKVEKKRAFVKSNLIRAAHMTDPLEKDGGSTKVLTQELQSVKDLEIRLEKVRYAIAKANIENQITLGETTKSIFEWITWKREISAASLNMTNGIHTLIKSELDKISKQPAVYLDQDQKTQIVRIIPNLDYNEFVKKAEVISDMIEQLDGKLSLKNATIVISI